MKAFVFLADGFEEIEGLTVVDILRRAQIETETVSVMKTKEICGSHNITVFADKLFEEIDTEKGMLFVLPGGMPGTLHLGAHEGLCALLKRADAQKKKIAAICAAPSVLVRLVFLRGARQSAIRDLRKNLLEQSAGHTRWLYLVM